MEAAASVSALQQPQDVTVQQNNAPEGVADAGKEARLIDFLASIQAQAQQGQQLGNPMALGNEAVSVLRGYLDRTQHLREKIAQKAQPMEGAEGQQAAGAGAGGMMRLASLGGQPQSAVVDAKGGLVPGGPNQQLAQSLDKVLDMLSHMLGFALETTLIGTATSNLSKSTTTLLHGQ